VISGEKIAASVSNPNELVNVTIEELDAIRNKFSFSSTLHLLYLKKLALTNDIRFEGELRNVAANCMDRERMYHLIHSGNLNIPQNSSKTIEINEEPIEQRILKTTTEEKIISPVDEKSAEANTISSETSVNQIEKTIDIETSHPVIEEKLHVSEQNEFIADQKLKEENLVSDAIENLVLPDVADALYEKELNITRPSVEKEKLTPEDEPKQKTIETSLLGTSKEKSNPEEKTSEPIDLSKLSFVEWLLYKQKQSKGEIITVQTTDKTQNEVLIESAEEKKQRISKIDIDALLTRFIHEEPSISRPKNTFFSPSKKAKKSLEETPDLVTETLAKIYFLQKNYTKAIKAYEQLSLVYPEKKTFFAVQIEKIKHEQNK